MNLAHTRWTETEFEKAPLEIIDGDRGKNYPKQSEFSNSGYCLFLNTGNVTSSGFNFSDCNFIGRERDAALRKGRLQKGDVLLTTRGTVGNTAWFDETIPYSVMRINSGMVILRTNTEKLIPEFLYFFLRSPKFGEQVNALTSGTAQPQLPIRDLKGIKIPLPPLEEQRRIAAILDKADAVRRKRKEAIALTEELRRSAFLDIFGDPVTNPKGWKIFELQSITERIVDCPHSTPKWTDKGVICLRTSNLTKGRWNWDDIRYVSEEDYTTRTQRSEIISGDIILSREGTVGIAAIVPEGFRVCMGQRLVQVRPDQKLIKPSYLLRVLLWQLAPEYISQLMRGSTSQHLNVKDLRSMPIPVPSLDLQEQFSKLVSQINSLEENMRNFSDEQDKNFNSVLQRAFRGEL